ncbi:MAG: hypothetical protein JW841_14950 [Deltaproteobacteria bacterium]|nr:hypothetical protein [Deltaproteobacteria bacterium]
MDLRKLSAVLILMGMLTSCACFRSPNYSEIATKVANLSFFIALPQVIDTDPIYTETLVELRSDYKVKFRQLNSTTYVLLICTKDGTRALMEDLNCTPQRVDGRYWEDQNVHQCTFNDWKIETACSNNNS